MNFYAMILCFVVGFLFVNAVKLIVLNSKIKQDEETDNYKSSISDAFKKTMPYMPLVYLVVWLVCSGFYFNVNKSEAMLTDALMVGAGWFVLLALFETISWVVVRHSRRIDDLSSYKESAAWLFLSYYTAFAGPLIFAFALS